MTDLILPTVQHLELPDESAIQWGLPVVSPPLIALADAAINLVATRARRWIHRSYHHATSYGTRGIPDLQTIHKIGWVPSWNLERVHLRAVYQADPNAKVTPSPSLKAELKDALIGGITLDALEWRFDLGTLPAEEEQARPEVYRYPPQSIATGPILTQPSAGLHYTDRPLEVGASALSGLIGVHLTASEGVRLLAVDIWEAFEEAIEQ